MTSEPLQPIRKILLVRLVAERAFELFTRDIHRWWPLLTLSIRGEQAESCVLECEVGGQVYETAANLPNESWGRVVTWSPPDLLVLDWRPGDLEAAVTEIRISFSTVGEGLTRIELIHHGWRSDQLDRYVEHRTGWDAILAKGFQAYVQRLAAEDAASEDE